VPPHQDLRHHRSDRGKSPQPSLRLLRCIETKPGGLRKAGAVNTDDKKIERQLTVLLRKSVRIHLSTQRGDVSLERSAYGIMCQLADEGPQRLGALAAAFGLDPSTITRQVRDLENAGFASRQTDPSDRRASVLDLTPCGRQVLEQSREHRRFKLKEALSNWSSSDLNDFGRLLQEFNTSMDRLAAFGVLVFTNGFVLG